MQYRIGLAFAATVLQTSIVSAADPLNLVSITLRSESNQGNAGSIVELRTLQLKDNKFDVDKQGSIVPIAERENGNCVVLHITSDKAINVRCDKKIVSLSNETELDKHTLSKGILVTGCQFQGFQSVPKGEAWIKTRLSRQETLFVDLRVEGLIRPNPKMTLELYKCDTRGLSTFRQSMAMSAANTETIGDDAATTNWIPLSSPTDSNSK